MQLAMVVALLEAERIEIGVQMAAHAIGADHHQGAHASRASRANVLAAAASARRTARLGAFGRRSAPRRLSALTHSPLAACGQSRRAQLGPCGGDLLPGGRTPISAKKFAPVGLTEDGSAS